MEAQPPRRLTLRVPPHLAGQTLDVILRRELQLSGTVLRRARRTEGGFLLDGQPAIAGQRAQAGQLVSVLVAGPGPNPELVPFPAPLAVVYEDADLLVVDKPPGLPVHPGPGSPSDTLCGRVAWYYQQTGLEAGVHLVHRLDRGTSGLMAVAKHPHAQQQLKLQLHTAAFRRIYLAVCDGVPHPLQGRVEAPIGRVPGSPIARRVDPAGQWAATRYQVRKAVNGRALVELELESGRTHQIRVHMAHLGCPLTGDFLYGTEDRTRISRPALHSARLELLHPVTGQAMGWSSPLPADMAALTE